MYAIKHLRIGDRITVFFHGRGYSTVVQDLPAPDKLVVARPTNRGEYLEMGAGGLGEVFFRQKSGSGILTFTVAEQGGFFSKGVPMMTLRAASEVKRSQRRSWFRLDKSLPAELVVKTENEPERQGPAIKAGTLDISAGGCRLAVRQPVESGALLQCRISLSPGGDLVVDGRVMWVEQQQGGEGESVLGVRFEGADEETRNRIVSYVTSEQRKQLRTKR